MGAGGETERDVEAEVQPAEGGDGRDGEEEKQARGTDVPGNFPGIFRLRYIGRVRYTG